MHPNQISLLSNSYKLGWRLKSFICIIKIFNLNSWNIKLRKQLINEKSVGEDISELLTKSKNNQNIIAKRFSFRLKAAHFSKTKPHFRTSKQLSLKRGKRRLTKTVISSVSEFKNINSFVYSTFTMIENKRKFKLNQSKD